MCEVIVYVNMHDFSDNFLQNKCIIKIHGIGESRLVMQLFPILTPFFKCQKLNKAFKITLKEA